MTIPSTATCWFIALGALVSLYQGYRGFMLQFILNKNLIENTFRRVVLLCIADAFTYFICSLTGFYALFLLHGMFEQSESPNAFIAIFLALYGLLGITAKLPEILTKIELHGLGGDK